MRKKAIFIRCLSALLFLPLVATQLVYGNDLRPLLDIAGGGGAQCCPLAYAEGGWGFHIDSPITIAAFGLWDEGKLPLNISHDVGIWNSDQTLLWVATVDNNSLPVASAFDGGQWLFTEIPTLQLQPGDYVLAAFWGEANIGSDSFRISTNAVTSGVSYTAACAKFQMSSPNLVFPDCGGGSLSSASYFGPNLAIVVPESGSMFLLGSGVIGLAGVLRRKINV